jgi:trigger factor
MQVSIETTSGLERRLTVGVPAETVDTRSMRACSRR